MYNSSIEPTGVLLNKIQIIIILTAYDQRDRILRIISITGSIFFFNQILVINLTTCQIHSRAIINRVVRFVYFIILSLRVDSVSLFSLWQVNSTNGSRDKQTHHQPVGSSETAVRILEQGQTIR